MTDLRRTKEDVLNRVEIVTVFHAGLLDDPKRTIEKYFPQPDGLGFPSGLKFVVVEDSEDTVFRSLFVPIQEKQFISVC